MMTPDIETLLWIFGWTLAIYILSMRLLSGANQRILYTLFVLCFFVYNGYGAAYPHGVYAGYGTMYIVFLATLSAGYVLFLALLGKETRRAQLGTMGLISRVFQKRANVNITIGAYFLLILFPLCYPEFKLPLLLSPPAPDIAQEFMQRHTNPPDAIAKMIQAVSYLIFPFYLISTTFYRKNLMLFAALIAIPYYIQYCAQSYISRGEVLGLLFIIAAVQWHFKPAIRKYILIGSLILLPIVPITLLWYQEARAANGQTDLDVSTGDAFEYLWYTEASFPVFSDKIISSGKRIDLKRYAIWIATLPIPKGIIGSVNPPSAGMEMSEILLGIKQGRTGFYALLAGLLTESAYIYGVKLYFIHALMIAFVMAFVARITERQPLLFVVFVAMTIDLSYRLNRAGVGAALPAVVNLYFTLYLLLLCGYLKNRFGAFTHHKVEVQHGS